MKTELKSENCQSEIGIANSEKSNSAAEEMSSQVQEMNTMVGSLVQVAGNVERGHRVERRVHGRCFRVVRAEGMEVGRKGSWSGAYWN